MHTQVCNDMRVKKILELLQNDLNHHNRYKHRIPETLNPRLILGHYFSNCCFVCHFGFLKARAILGIKAALDRWKEQTNKENRVANHAWSVCGVCVPGCERGPGVLVIVAIRGEDHRAQHHWVNAIIILTEA